MQNMDTKQRQTRTPRQYEPVDYVNYAANVPVPKAPSPDYPDLKPIALEDAPLGGRAFGVQLLKDRVKMTVEMGIPVGRAFPVPAKSRTTIISYVREHWPECKWSVSYMKGQPFARIIRKA